MKHIHSITFTILFLAATASVTFRITIDKTGVHTYTSKIKKNHHTKSLNNAQDKFAVLNFINNLSA
jgi:hypothetical protein